MLESSRPRTERNSISPYRRDAHPGPTLGEVMRCELCEHEAQCFEQHGFTACRDCHRDLLPGEDVF